MAENKHIEDGPFKGMTNEQVRALPNAAYKHIKSSYKKKQKNKDMSGSVMKRLKKALSS